MAWVEYGRAVATARQATLYSRYHSPDRRLYTETVAREMHRSNPVAEFWVYEPHQLVLPIRPLTAQTRRSLARALPF